MSCSANLFAKPRILIVGCGDVGSRMVALLASRHRVYATARTVDHFDALRAVGAIPIHADLDSPATLQRLGGLAPVVIHLAPPRNEGSIDVRTRALLSALHGVQHLVYVSTSGVYGDAGGAWIDETRAVAPQTPRAARRVDAERQLRAWARHRHARVAIVRVPGIYASDRLPLARLAARTPVLDARDDVYTNHIHADDLARLLVTLVHRGANTRVYHAVDDSAICMGDWFDLLADAFAIERPERMRRDAIVARIAPNLLSFMSESRRLTNARMKAELNFRLRYPTVREGVADAVEKKARGMRALDAGG